jgi:hypothetical protein
MNANDAHNKELYISARERHSIGRTNMTDAAIVAEQEKEIERYRNKIKWLEKELREKPTREFAFGSVCEIGVNGEKQTFTITEAVIEYSVECRPTITIEGIIHSKVSE